MTTQLSILPIIESNFYNTISLSGDELKQAKEVNGIQDQRVLEIFRLSYETKEYYHDPNPNKATPFEIHYRYEERYGKVPITSIRRSITVLTKQGFLVKTDEMKMEKFGKRNYMWKIVEK